MRRIALLFTLLFPSPAAAEILKVRIDGVIDPVTSEFITGAVETAEAENVEFLLIELSTPGGLGFSMQEIIEDILNSQVPIVCYVHPKGARAASAGFFILLSADVAAMSPGTNTGAAHPVFPFGAGDEKMLEKVTNDALAGLRSIVQQRKRNYELAEKGVLESTSYTEKEALEGGLIDLVAEDEEQLLTALEGREIVRFDGQRQVLSTKGQNLRLLEMTFRQKVLSTIADPNMAMLLGLIGVLGLYLEFTSPGLLVPGVLGGIALLLALMGFSLLPINLVGVLLILLGVGLLVAELTMPGFGLFGIGGVISLTLGLLFLIDSPNPEVRIQWSAALAVAVSFAVILLFMVGLVLKTYRGEVRTGIETLVGLTGIARTAVDQGGGKVFVNGEWWDAVAPQSIAEGDKVKVVSDRERVLRVEPWMESDRES